MDEPPPDTIPIPDTSRTVKWLNDSLFQSILDPDYEDVKSLIPSYKLFKVYMDSLIPGVNEINKKSKYAKITYRIKRQHDKFNKKTRSLEMSIKRIQLDSTKYGPLMTGPTSKYRYVTMYCSRKNKLFEVRYLAMEFLGQWCLVDELRLQNYRKKKKKKRRKL